MRKHLLTGLRVLALAVCLAPPAEAQNERQFPSAILDRPGQLTSVGKPRPFPATLLLQALELVNPSEGRRAEYAKGSREIDDPALRQFAKDRGLVIRQLTVPPLGAGTGQGLGVLRTELSDRGTFNLLYTSPDCLIAVFPAMEAGEQAAFARWKYFDLTPFYFTFPQRGAGALQEWVRFAELTRQRRALIQAYKKFLRLDEEVKPAYAAWRKPYVRVAIDAPANRIDLRELDPEELLDQRVQEDLKSLLTGRSRPEALIFPVFPTVYSPADPSNLEEDVDFGTDVHQVMQRVELRSGDAVLDIGTGSGYLAWLAWATARRAGARVEVFTLDINPVAVANSRVLAQLAGYPLTTRVYDNVISRRGEYAFPGRRFRYVIWNMPAVSQTGFEGDENTDPSRLADYWDGGGNGVEALKRFAPAVAGLFDPAIRTSRDGRPSKSTAVIWNLLTPRGRDIVGPAFRQAGLDADLLEVFPFRESTCVIYVLTAPSGS